jgi:hypothetical protein
VSLKRRERDYICRGSVPFSALLTTSACIHRLATFIVRYVTYFSSPPECTTVARVRILTTSIRSLIVDALYSSRLELGATSFPSGPETTEFQSHSENSPRVLASFHTTAVSPLHCRHSGSFCTSASSLATLPSPPRPPSAARQPLDPQHYSTASDMPRGHKLTPPRVWNYDRWRDARGGASVRLTRKPTHADATLQRNTAPHPHHTHARK